MSAKSTRGGADLGWALIGCGGTERGLWSHRRGSYQEPIDKLLTVIYNF